jgi:sigma-B regulation protein RsbU (phosphoserine phosphatase)
LTTLPVVTTGTGDEQGTSAASLTAALADLDAHAVTEELLARLGPALVVDESAVLVVDQSGRQLVAYASRGLEEEVRQGIRVPVGRGFAGRVAAERRPIVLEDVGPDKVVNPLLWRTGLRTLLGVPLIANRRLVGVLHVGSRQRRQFSDADIALVQLAAERIAISVAAEQMMAEQHAARVMQRGLLPTQMPDVPGLQIATRFVAAESFGVGGDWYDAFHLPDGALGFVIGDVAGHGLQAAVVMSRMRSVVRAYALEHASPATVLERVDAKFRHFEPDEMATLIYARLDADLGRMTVANAGHLPPVLCTPGADAVLLDVFRDPPICIGGGVSHGENVFDFPPGSVLTLFTDGLVERRHQPIDDGLELLRATVTTGDAEQIAADIMDELIGGLPVDDDTALLIVARS